MLQRLLGLYQRYAAHRMFSRWSRWYEVEVMENQYSAPEAIAKEAAVLIGEGGDAYPLVADIGIGTGLLAQLIQDARPCRIIGLDFSEHMMAVAGGRGIAELLVKCDVGKDIWPIESGSCDMVVSAGLLEYLTPSMLEHYFRESKRVLKKDGYLIFTYKPRMPQQRGINLWPGYSGTYLTCSYVPAEIEELLRQNEFKTLRHSVPFKGCIFTDGTYYDYRMVSARSSNS